MLGCIKELVCIDTKILKLKNHVFVFVLRIEKCYKWVKAVVNLLKHTKCFFFVAISLDRESRTNFSSKNKKV